jgi:hypothetical protein
MYWSEQSFTAHREDGSIIIEVTGTRSVASEIIYPILLNFKQFGGPGWLNEFSSWIT